MKQRPILDIEHDLDHKTAHDSRVPEDVVSPARATTNLKGTKDREIGLKKLPEPLFEFQNLLFPICSNSACQLPRTNLQSKCACSQPNAAIEQVVLVYWLDIYEDKYNCPGRLFLFGKALVNTSTGYSTTPQEPVYKNICVEIENMHKTVYFLPPKAWNATEAYKGVKRVMDQILKSNEKTSERFRMRKVKRKFCFENQHQEATATLPNGVYDVYKVKYPARLFASNTSGMLSLLSFMFDLYFRCFINTGSQAV